MKLIYFLFLLSFLTAQISAGQIVLRDNIKFSFSDDSHLDLLTENPDSVNPFFDNPCPGPGSPGMRCLSIYVTIHDTSYLKVSFKDIHGEKMGTFVWSKIKPGVYRFDWWENYGFDSSGFYFAETKAKKFSKTKKFIYIK
jgi:hypothetical protein